MKSDVACQIMIVVIVYEVPTEIGRQQTMKGLSDNKNACYQATFTHTRAMSERSCYVHATFHHYKIQYTTTQLQVLPKHHGVLESTRAFVPQTLAWSALCLVLRLF